MDPYSLIKRLQSVFHTTAPHVEETVTLSECQDFCVVSHVSDAGTMADGFCVLPSQRQSSWDVVFKSLVLPEIAQCAEHTAYDTKHAVPQSFQPIDRGTLQEREITRLQGWQDTYRAEKLEVTAPQKQQQAQGRPKVWDGRNERIKQAAVRTSQT